MKQLLKKMFWWIGAPITACAALYIFVTVTGGSSITDSITFLWRFLQHPHQIGAIAPSSNKLAEALLARIPVGANRHILEVGAGTGAVTKHLVQRMLPGDRLDVIELDADLAGKLQNYYHGMRGVRVYHGSILQWSPGCKYDAIVAGVPFNAMKCNQVKAIFERYHALLKENGVLSYFSYAGLPDIKEAFLQDKEKEDFQSIQAFLADQQRTHGIDRVTVMANLPPAHVHYLAFT